MFKLTLQSILQTLLWTVVAGCLYPLVVTGIAKVAFKDQAEGSLVVRDGKILGSKFIAQQFQGPTYFWPRPSAGGYATVPSGASNLGPTSSQLQQNVQGFAKTLRDAHKLPADAPVPADLVFTSASGLDPDITPEAARFQVGRVAAGRHMNEADVAALVEKSIQPPSLGFIGEARVNVLLLNVALDAMDTKTAH